MYNARLVTKVGLEPEVPFERKKLKPIYDRETYHKPLARELEAIWYHILYKPLLAILTGKDVRANTKNAALLRAVSQRIS